MLLHRLRDLPREKRRRCRWRKWFGRDVVLPTGNTEKRSAWWGRRRRGNAEFERKKWAVTFKRSLNTEEHSRTFKWGDEFFFFVIWQCEELEITHLWMNLMQLERETVRGSPTDTGWNTRGVFFFFFFLLELNDNTELNTPNCSGLSRNTVGYQQRRSAVCERVTERLEIVSGGASLHLISAVRRGLPTLEINWMIYFGVTPAALSPCFSCRLCNTVQRSRSRGGCLTWTAWLRCTVAALVQ